MSKCRLRAENFAIIVEKSGATTNQVAPLLYGKGLIDITNALMAELSKKRSDTKEVANLTLVEG